jgi:hypothetical protein
MNELVLLAALLGGPEQCARWRGLKKLQDENDAKDKAAEEKPAHLN